jgi:hypothetical protein
MRTAFYWLLYGVLPALMSCSAAGVGRKRSPVECRDSPAVVLRAFGLDGLSAHIPHVTARAQARDFGGTVCLTRALRLGLGSILVDSRDPESAGAVVGAGCLVCELNHRETSLRLVTRDDPMPEGGEAVAGNWVFELHMPRVSDHVYWAVVARAPDRRGEVQVYNYGFN